jgi:protein transport protein SEC23
VRLSASLFPADAALANRGGVPLGAVVHPFGDGETSAETSAFSSTTIRKPPTRCETCGAFVNGFCPVNARNGHWACVFCGSGNVHRCLINPVDADAAALPELAAREVEYVFSSRRETDKTTQNADADAALRASRGPSDAIRDESFSTNGNGPVFFVLDESLDADESRLMRRSVSRALDALPDDKEVGLAAFAGAVSVYDVAASTRKSISALDGVAPVVASVVPGHRSPDAHDLLDVLDETRGGARRFIARLGDEGVRETFAAAVKALAPIRRRGGGDQGAARTRPRSLGAAVETAVAVLESVSSSSGKESEPGKERHKNQNRGRVIVCLGGPPTRGPGAAAADFSSEFYDAEERAARKYVETLAETVRFAFFFIRARGRRFAVLLFSSSWIPRNRNLRSVMSFKLNLC